MMKRVKRLIALTAALGLTASLTACGGSGAGGLSKEDAEVYVTGMLEENYYGTASDAYKKLMDVEDKDITDTYEESMEVEVEYFLYNYNIEYASDELREELVELYKEIYSHARFEVVSAAEQDDGSYSVKVTVEPINIVHLVEEKLDEALEPWYEKYPTEVQDELDEEGLKAADAEWADIIFKAYKDKLPEIGNLEAKSTTVQLEKDEDGLYSIVSDDFYRLDALILDYPYYEAEA